MNNELVEQTNLGAYITLDLFFRLIQIEIVGGGNGKCLAEFTVEKENLNRAGGLHGGFTATVVDNFTTYALLTSDHPPGVTVDLHVRLLFFAVSPKIE